MFAVAQYAFPSGEGGSRRLTDEENVVCNAQRAEADIIQ